MTTQLRSAHPLWMLLILLVSLFAINGCPSSCSDVTVNPGKVYGDIVFTNTNTTINNYLSGNQVIDSLPTNDVYQLPVKFFQPTSPDLHSATTYSADNLLVDSQTYTAAHYANTLNIENSAIDLLLMVQNIRFSDNATYRFGSTENTSPDKQLCNNIQPLSVDADGLQCDIQECPTLLTLPLQFVTHPVNGDPSDLDAIDDQPVICTAYVYTEDTPGSNNYILQAESAPSIFTRENLLNGSAEIRILARSSDTVVRADAICSVKIKNGETGFVVNPENGLTSFGNRQFISSAGCGSTPTENIDIIVERTGGELQGYFDISGEDEIGAQIIVDPPYSIFKVTPPLVPATAVPTEKWHFAGVPIGARSISGKAIVNNGNNYLSLPLLGGPNGAVFVLGPPFTTDTKARLVSQTQSVKGTLRLFDIAGLTDLNNLDTIPFTSLYASQKTYLAATGAPGLAPNGASGIGAESKAVLQGSYNPATHQALYQYELLLAGISDPEAAIDGSQAKTTPWDINHLKLFFSNMADGYQYGVLTPGLDLHYLAQPGAGDATPPPEINFCFGKNTMTLNLAPALGSLYGPSVTLYEDGAYQPAIATTVPTTVNFTSKGNAQSHTEATSQVSIPITLPEGYRYRAYPSVRIIPAGGDVQDASYTSLGLTYVPESKALSCGESTHDCIDITDSDGNNTRLSVAITDSSGALSPEYCLENGDYTVTINVQSDAVNVTRVAYVLDPPSTDVNCDSANAQVLCATGCGPNPSFPVTFTGLTNGAHTIKACVVNQTNCQAQSSAVFHVDNQPIVLQCPADFSVSTTIGETSIAASDPRIADNLIAQVTGNCGLPTTITDNRPSEFAIGNTVVDFSSSLTQGCSTTVSVNQPQEPQLAYLTAQSGVGELHVHNIGSNTEAFSFPIFGSPAAPVMTFRYSPDGSKLGLTQNQHVMVLDANTGLTLPGSIASPSADAHYNYTFNPVDQRKYAVVSRKVNPADPTINNDQYVVHLLDGNTLLDSYPLPITPFMSIPELDWSIDGNVLTSSYYQPNLNNSSRYTVYVNIWSNPFTDLDQITPLDQVKQFSPREELYEVVRLPDNTLYHVTSHGTSKITTSSFTWQAQVPNLDMDMAEQTGAAVAIVDDAGSYKIKHLSDATQASGGTVTLGPTLSGSNLGKPQIAISPDGQYAGLILNDRIAVYALPDLTAPVTEVMATHPQGVKFRP